MNSKSQKAYEAMMEYQHQLHEQNRRRIRIGLRCVYIIPAVFLALMFLFRSSGTGKSIFLALWVASLFGISLYLILIEYVDYNLQQKLNEIEGKEDEEIDPLMDVPAVPQQLDQMREQAAQRRKELKIRLRKSQLRIRTFKGSGQEHSGQEDTPASRPPEEDAGGDVE